ncbi:MAG: FAD:protein FMN transferase [Deltaproteobacteria bacterium]|nr:FAD:protein FMN transferase [Deltaproteobacteria bacterium]
MLQTVLVSALAVAAAGVDAGQAVAEARVEDAGASPSTSPAGVDDESAVAPAEEEPPPLARLGWAIGETEVELLLLASDHDRALVAAQRAREQMGKLWRALDEREPASDLFRLAQANGRPLALAPDVFDALADAQRLARLSGGAFDPTAGRLWTLWGFSGRGTVPDTDLLKAALELVDYRRLQLEPTERTALLTSGAQVRLGAIGRGLVLERGVAELEQSGLSSFVLRAGGDVVVRGTKGRQPWMVGVQDPRAGGYFAAFPVLRRGAVATAGDYERYFVRAGARFHDLLDPRTGMPARCCRSATVLGRTADEAAGLAQVVFVLGPDEGFALLQRLDQVEAIVVDGQNRVHVTSGLLPSVRFRPPTDGR